MNFFDNTYQIRNTKPCNNESKCFFQPKLEINTPGDPSEQQADAVAEQVMRMKDPFIQPKPMTGIQRKCAHCEEEEKSMQRKETSGTKAKAGEGFENYIDNLQSSGQTMPEEIRNFYEPRFGYDFSTVKLHTDSVAAKSAQSVNALAYTSGNNIVFNNGQYSPGTDSGKKLLAHELTHVVQQGNSKNSIQRKLSVEDPATNIPNPTGKGKVATNAQIAESYLQQICSAGGITVNKSGDVDFGKKSFCSDISYIDPWTGKSATIPSSAKRSGTAVGCTCICDIISSSNAWKIKIDDGSWPHTDFDDHVKASTLGSGGSGGIVTTISPNSTLKYGAATASGKITDIDPWLILGHELCGHAWMGDKGDHAKDEAKTRGEGGHQETVERENLLRDEHGLERRGTHREPFCGESFSHDPKVVPTDKSVTWSSSLAICKKWRVKYNKLNKTSFKISDPIPIKPGEKLP